MPSVTLKNCCDSVIGVIVFNPADIVRAVDAGQYLIQPGESQNLDTFIGGMNFSVGICYDTYYQWTDPKFACYWGTTIDMHGIRGNWMKYRLLHIENEDLDSTICVNKVCYCSENGDGMVLKRQNGQQMELQPFSDQQYREVSLGFLLSMLAPLMGHKQEGDITKLGMMLLGRITQTGLTVKDMSLLACGFLRLYHLQQAKGNLFQGGSGGGFQQAAHQAGQKFKEHAPELAGKASQQGHQVASQIHEKGQEFGGKGQEIGSQIASKGHEMASNIGQQGQQIGQKGQQVAQQAGEQSRGLYQSAQETGQQISDAVREFLRSVGLESAMDKITSGDLTSKDVEQIVVMLLKLSGTSDYRIEQLYSELGMDAHVLFTTWWNGTQGHIEGAHGGMAGQSGFGGQQHKVGGLERQEGINAGSQPFAGVAGSSSSSGGVGGVGAKQQQFDQPAGTKHGLETKQQPMDISNQENLGTTNRNAAGTQKPIR